MKKTSKWISLLLAGTLALALLTGCGGGNADSGAGSAADSGNAPAQDTGTDASTTAGETIKIGYLCEKTTAVGFTNDWAEIAVLQWVDEFNENGGVDGKQVELVYYDAQNDPTLATQRLSEMKADGMVACLEIACAGHMAPAIAEWCSENHFPVIHTCNTATAFTINISSPYMFHTSVNAWGMAKVLAENAVGKEGNNTFVYIGVDEACCLDAEFFLEREGQKFDPDCKELASYRVSWDDSQFSTIISTILTMDPKPTMILQQGGGSNFINIVRQANMYNAFDYFDIYNDLAVDTSSCSDLAAAGEFPYGHVKGYCTLRWWDDSTKDFTDGFYASAERHGASPDLVPGDLSYASYNAGKALGIGLLACAEAGDDYTDGDTLTQYIHDASWSDGCGDHYFRDFDNQLTFDSYYVVSADGGEERNSFPISDGTSEVKYTADEYLPTFEEMDAYAQELGVTDWDVSDFWN